MTPAPLYALFDLDGTLVDPQGAITDGVADALADHGIERPDEATLRTFVGPPMTVRLEELYGLDAETARHIVDRYRKKYVSEGMFKSEVYAQVPQVLATLEHAGVHLAVVTQKPQPVAHALLDAMGLSDYFANVYGDLGAETEGKEPILRRALADLPAGSRAIMIGDRRYDIEAAQALGIPGWGVAWGYAAPGELEAAGAQWIAATPEELGDKLLEVNRA